MLITIDKEANSRRKLVTDLDKFKEFYITSNGYFKFPGFSTWPLEKNRFFLISNSEKLVLDAKYYYRPDYLSYDYYGIEILWPIILFVNNCFSREEFDSQEVLIPTLDSIIAVCRDKFRSIDTSETTEVNL